MTSSEAHQPSDALTIGAPVLTQDGQALGSIKELSGPYFKVDASGRRDYWLQVSFARWDTAGHVVVDFTHDELHDYEVRDISG